MRIETYSAMWRLILVLSVLLSTGCAKNMTPPLREFAVTPPQRWTIAGTLPGEVESKWWAGFGDAGLEKAIVQALANNHDLKSAAARVEAARFEARIAGAGRFPEVGVRLSRGRQRQNFVGLPIPGSEDGVLNTTYTSAGVSLDLSWEVDVWSRLKAGHQFALATAEARQADWVSARLSLSGQTAKAWFAAVEAERQVGLARALWENARLSEARVRERFERGLRPSLDLRLALTEVTRAKAALRQRTEQRARAVRQLEILLGHYPRGEYTLGEDLPSPPAKAPAGLPSELVHRRPDLIASERELLAADARVFQSKAELRPRFALTTAGGMTSNRLRKLVDLQFMAWSLVGNLTQPLFQGGRLKAAVRRDNALARAAFSNYESALLRAYAEVESALAAEEDLAEREAALEAATRQSFAALGEAERRYGAGLTDILTMLASQGTAFASESELLMVRRLRLDNRVDLHLALGGGFETEDPRS